MTKDQSELRNAFFSAGYLYKYPKDSGNDFCFAMRSTWSMTSQRDIGGICMVLASKPTTVLVDAVVTARLKSVCSDLATASSTLAAEIAALTKQIATLTGTARTAAEASLKQKQDLAAQGPYSCSLVATSPKQYGGQYQLCTTVNGCAKPSNPTDGFDERALRYGWPGPLTQSVREAFVDGSAKAPDGSWQWANMFNAHPSVCGDTSKELAYPLVLHPPVEAEAATRLRLQQAADLSKTVDGHYRFFAYSRGDIIKDMSHSPTVNALWPASVNTLPMMCSSFVWKVMTDAGFNLGTNEPRTTDTPPGMFLYSEAQRKTAAHFLHTTLYDLAQGQAPNIGWLVDAADDVSNQITNCFASDLCTPGNWSLLSKSGADSDAWTEPGTGITVSPDDLLKWNGAASGGPWGDSERLLYRDASYPVTSEWAASAGTGTLTGTVIRNDLAHTPVTGAPVSVAGVSLTTDAAGHFDAGPLPAGEYDVTVTATIAGTPVEQSQHVTVVAAAAKDMQFVFAGPRLITIAGATHIVDGETTFNEIRRHLTAEILQVSDANSSGHEVKKVWRTPCVGDEVDMRFDYTAEWMTGPGVVPGTIKVTVQANLFENSACLTEERENIDIKSVTLAPNEQGELDLATINEDGSPFPDHGYAKLLIINGEYFQTGAPTLEVRLNGKMHVFDYDRFSANEMGDQFFDVTKTLSPDQRAQSMGEISLNVDNEVIGRFDTMVVLEANNKDVRVFSNARQEDTGVTGFGCDTTGGWIDQVLDGADGSLDHEITECSNYIRTTFTVTKPGP
jgi:hypothetical protein